MAGKWTKAELDVLMATPLSRDGSNDHPLFFDINACCGALHPDYVGREYLDAWRCRKPKHHKGPHAVYGIVRGVGYRAEIMRWVCSSAAMSRKAFFDHRRRNEERRMREVRAELNANPTSQRVHSVYSPELGRYVLTVAPVEA